MPKVETIVFDAQESHQAVNSAWIQFLSRLVLLSSPQLKTLKDTSPLLLPAPVPENGQAQTTSETTPHPHIEATGNGFQDIINFTIREVLPLKTKAEKIAVLRYYFHAILTEAHRLPVTNRVYDIETINYEQTSIAQANHSSAESPSLQLLDHGYQLRPDVLQTCQATVQAVQAKLGKTTNQEERLEWQQKAQRFQLELQQIEALINYLETALQIKPPTHGLIAQINQLAIQAEVNTTASADATNPSNNQPENVAQPDYAALLTAQGWQPANELLTPTRAQALNNNLNQPNNAQAIKPFAECWVAQKQLYLMPQSAVHPGGYTMAVIVQPAFLPETGQWILLHDQHMYQADWLSHLQLLTSLGVSLPADLARASTQQLKKPNAALTAKLEKFVMSQLVNLPPQLQTADAQAAFLAIRPQNKLTTRIKQAWRERQLQGMEQTLDHLADYWLHVLETEQAAQGLSIAQTEKTISALKRVVFAHLLGLDKISVQNLEQLKQHYRQHDFDASDPAAGEKGFALSLGNLSPSALKGFNLSLIECLAGTPLSALNGALNPEIFSALNAGMINPAQLTELFGHGREFKKGTCVKCQASNTWVGECGWCWQCELQDRSQQSLLNNLTAWPTTLTTQPLLEDLLTDQSPTLANQWLFSTSTRSVNNWVDSFFEF